MTRSSSCYQILIKNEGSNTDQISIDILDLVPLSLFWFSVKLQFYQNNHCFCRLSCLQIRECFMHLNILHLEVRICSWEVTCFLGERIVTSHFPSVLKELCLFLVSKINPRGIGSRFPHFLSFHMEEYKIPLIINISDFWDPWSSSCKEKCV